MSATTELPVSAAPRHALPDPGERVPAISWPIVGIFSGAIAVFAFSTWAALTDRLPAPATVLLSRDATGRVPNLWFGDADEHETPRQRFHIEVYVAPEAPTNGSPPP